MPASPIGRRTFLRGSGVALGLPLLDAMTPRGRAATPATSKRRMVAVCTTLGIHTPYLFPEKAGREYAPTPYLDAMKDHRDDITVVSGVSHPEVDGGHSAEASFLTCAPHPGATGFRNTISLDQFAAERMDADTRFPSLVLGTHGGGSLSWTRSGVMIPSDYSQAKVFARLFLDGTAKEVAAQVRRLKDGRSVMDAVGDRAKGLQKGVGPADRDKLDQYFTAVREVEQRLARAEEWSKKPKPKVAAKPPTDNIDRADIIGRTRLMYDLIHLALQTDSTRVVTLQVQCTGFVPTMVDGVTLGHHELSHHGKDPDKLAQLKAVETAEFAALGEFLGKLKGSKEDGETLLDRTAVLFGSNLGNASSHDTRNMPVVLAGGGFRHGQHLAFDPANNAPLGNLYVSLLQRLGVEDDSFASGRGTLRGLEVKA